MNTVERTHDVLNGLDPALVEQADRTAKKRMSHPIRTALIAACLCATLLGAALADEELLKDAGILKYFSSEFSTVMRQIDPMYQIIPGSEDSYSGYVIPWEGSAVSMDIFSREVQEMLRRSENATVAESIRFGSTAELENYIGVALYENAVLDQLEQRMLAENPESPMYDENGELLESGSDPVGAVLNCIGYENGLTRLDLLSYYSMNNGAMEVTVTAEVLSKDLKSNGTAIVFTAGTKFSEEVFVTSGGSRITIIRCDIPETDGLAAYTEYTAHFHAYGVRYQVRITCFDHQEEGGKLMMDILDAFAFNEL